MPSVEQNLTSFPINVGPIPVSAKNAEKARIWAEGTDQEVTPLGGEHSAKGWAGVSAEKAQEAATSAEEAAESASKFVIDEDLSSTSKNAVENRAVYNAIYNLKMVQIVEELPATGDGKSIYGVIQDEMTRDGYPIVQLFCWDIEEETWYAVAAYSIDINPVGIVYVDSVPYATSTRVGGFKENFDASTGTWTVTTEEL